MDVFTTEGGGTKSSPNGFDLIDLCLNRQARTCLEEESKMRGLKEMKTALIVAAVGAALVVAVIFLILFFTGEEAPESDGVPGGTEVAEVTEQEPAPTPEAEEGDETETEPPAEEPPAEEAEEAEAVPEKGPAFSFSEYLDGQQRKARERNEKLAGIMDLEVPPPAPQVPEPAMEVGKDTLNWALTFIALGVGVVALILIAIVVKKRTSGGGGPAMAPSLLVVLLVFAFFASSVEAGPRENLHKVVTIVAEHDQTLDMLVDKAQQDKEADAETEVELEGLKSIADSLKLKELAKQGKTLAQFLAESEKNALEAGKKQAKANATAIAAIKEGYIKECRGSERQLAAVIVAAAGIDLSSIEVPEGVAEAELTPIQKLKNFVDGVGEGYNARKVWQNCHEQWTEALIALIVAARGTPVVAVEEVPEESEIAGLSKAALAALDKRYASLKVRGKGVLREGDVEVPTMPDMRVYAKDSTVQDAFKEVGLLDGTDFKKAALATELAEVRGVAEGASIAASTAQTAADAAKNTAGYANRLAKATALSHASHLGRKDKDGFVGYCATLKKYGLTLADLGWKTDGQKVSKLIEELADHFRKEKKGLSKEDAIRMAETFILKKD